MLEMGGKGGNSLISEYAALLSDALLRRRAWFAEHMAHVEHEMAASAKFQFATSIHDQLCVPLKTIVGLTLLLGQHDTRHFKDSEIVGYADLISAAGTHLLTAINDVLDISNTQSGQNTVSCGAPEIGVGNSPAAQAGVVSPPGSAMWTLDWRHPPACAGDDMAS